MLWYVLAYAAGVATPYGVKNLHERYWPRLQAVLREVL